MTDHAGQQLTTSPSANLGSLANFGHPFGIRWKWAKTESSFPTKNHCLGWQYQDDAGHASGQGLTAGQVDGQGLLSRQAKSNAIWPVCRVMWLQPMNDGRLVWESIASWDRACLWASLWWWQQQQQSCRQAMATWPDSWLVEENYLVLWLHSVDWVLETAIAYGDNSKSCHEHFWGVSSVKTPKTYWNLSSVLIVDCSFSIAGPN